MSCCQDAWPGVLYHKGGVLHCSFINSQAVEGLKMWNERDSASSTLFISANPAQPAGDAGVSPAVNKEKTIKVVGSLDHHLC